MFDVSFAELMVVALVALVVIGPEKLPKMARMLGTWVGKAQRFVAAVKLDMDRETQFQDLQQLQNEIRDSLIKAKSRIDTEMAPLEKAASDNPILPKTSLEGEALQSPIDAGKSAAVISEQFLQQATDPQLGSHNNSTQAPESIPDKNN